GRTSPTVTLVAGSGPLSVSVTVNVIVSPTFGVVLLTIFTSARSAGSAAAACPTITKSGKTTSAAATNRQRAKGGSAMEAATFALSASALIADLRCSARLLPGATLADLGGQGYPRLTRADHRRLDLERQYPPRQPTDLEQRERGARRGLDLEPF